MPETPPQGPLPDAPTRYGAIQYVAPHLVDDPPVIASLGRHLLLEVARADKRVLVGEVVETKRVPAVFAVVEQPDGTLGQTLVEQGSVLDTTGRAEPDAYLLAWECDTGERIPDPDPVRGVSDGRGLVRGELDEQERLNGGQVNFVHGIDGEATIRAYSDADHDMSYLFAVEIERGEHQVEVHPGTAYLTAELDPDTDDDTDGNDDD